MHPSVMDFLYAAAHPNEISGKSVLEVGSYNVNGTPRTVFEAMKPGLYIGIDQGAGPGVDLVLPAGQLIEGFGKQAFDVVVSTEMLEHVQDWRLIVGQLKGVLKIGGLLFVTTRSPGFPYHAYPDDYWRYTIEDFRKIFADMEILELVSDPLPGHPGVFLKARRKLGPLLTDEDLKDVKLGNAR